MDIHNHLRILRFIDLIRGEPAAEGLDKDDTSANIITEVFTTGNCGNFALALQTAFGGQLWRSASDYHILCKIGDRLYDINGDVTDRHSRGEVVDEHYVINGHYADNYSFAERGPII